jgi:hypothetical protein
MSIFYAILHAKVHLFCIYLVPRYQKLSKPKRGDYRANVISPVHSISSVAFSVIAMFYICGHGQTTFNSETCLNTPRYLHIWALVNTCGYFVVDTINIFVVGNFTT